jgi:hypothetical protein
MPASLFFLMPVNTLNGIIIAFIITDIKRLTL